MPKPFKYTPEIISFLQAHWNIDRRGEDLAAQLGISYIGLKAAVSRLRRQGFDFKEKAIPLGTEIEYKAKGGGVVVKVKTPSGMEYVRSEGRKFKKAPVSKPRERDRTKPKSQMASRKSNKGSGQASIFETSRNPPKIKIKDSQAVIAEKLANGWDWFWLNPKTKVLRSPEKLLR